nr:MAG TPA: Cytosine specific methyltransferase [Caudoviricetes sp.]
MRERERSNGRTGELVRPRYMVWENVPGTLSSNRGNDFAAALEEIIKIAEPEAPHIQVPKYGWPTWGGYRDVAGRWSVAYRIHDAQWWGVPQRRRRISVVADFGGSTAHEILFEPCSMSGNPTESGTQRERLAGATETGTSYTVRIRGGCDGGGKGALVQTEKSGTLGTGNDGDPAPTITSADKHIVAAFKSGQGAKARSIGYEEELSPTLSAVSSGTNQVPAILDMSHANDVIRECGEVVPSLQARMGTGGNQVPLTYQQVTGTLSPGAHAGSYNGQDAYNDMLVAHALRARGNCTFREDSETFVLGSAAVRRLTPLECTRLQGFPDGWVDLGEWTDEKGRVRKEADAPKYKALGNSIALPFWEWLLRRISEHLPKDATLGSLFDGIGGFPLCWAKTHGAENCRWASEIEQFPIAVVKRHFGDEDAGTAGDIDNFCDKEEMI